MEEEWEMLQKHDMGHPPVPDLAENSRDLEGIEGASEGAIRSDYFSLDSETRYPKRVVEDDREESSVESNNPSWVDPDGGGGGLGFGGIELPRRNYGGSWSDSSSDGSVSRKLGAFDGKPELGYADDAKSRLLVGGIGVERKKFDNFWLDSEVKHELGIGDDAKGEVGSEGIGIKRKISGEFWSDSGSDISIREKHGGGEGDSELGWGDLLKTGERLKFGGSAEVEGDEFYGKTNDAPEENEMKSSDAEKKRMAWWKLPLELLKFCTFRISPVWSFSIAAAVVGFVILGRRLYKMKHKSQNIQLRFSLDDKVDLTGGYYDAGDNVKFGLPMAFTTTMLSWSVLEFGKRMPKEVDRAREAVRWGADYLLKASCQLPNALYVQVGDANADHKCWQRAEDINAQPIFKVTPKKPGSEVAGETAAALAAASVVFRTIDPQYSKTLVATAEKAFEFADKYRGNYSDSLASVVCPFYCSYSGYKDELLWAAGWLYKATRKSSYLDYTQSLNIEDDSDVFSWDNKLAGARVLLSRYPHDKDPNALQKNREKAERFMCSVLPNSPSATVKYTPGGLMYKLNGSNLQYVTSSTFLLTTYAKYLQSSDGTFKCGDLVVTRTLLREQAKKQVDYILGDNPSGMSYMVGFGNRFPQRIHHRGSSLPNIQLSSEIIGCESGFDFYKSTNPNPNILTGAIVGGPDLDDSFLDDRNNYAQSEPATYINAALVGPLAYFADRFHP